MNAERIRRRIQRRKITTAKGTKTMMPIAAGTVNLYAFLRRPHLRLRYRLPNLPCTWT